MNIITRHILLITLCLGSTATYAASNTSLWGGIDAPVPPIQQIEHEQQKAQEQDQLIANQKTICELLSGQTNLSGDTANTGKVREALQQAYKLAAPEYKMFLVGSDAANDLYAKYRDLYMKTNCVAGKP